MNNSPTSNRTPSCHIMSEIAQQFCDSFQGHTFSLPDTNITSVVELLYSTYTDCLGRDPQEIQDGFLALDNYLDPLAWVQTMRSFPSSVSSVGPMKRRHSRMLYSWEHT